MAANNYNLRRRTTARLLPRRPALLPPGKRPPSRPPPPAPHHRTHTQPPVRFPAPVFPAPVPQHHRMAALKASIHIDPFDGTQDPNQWLDTFNLYSNALELNENQKVAAFPLTVSASTKLWYQTLPAATKANYDLLTAAFLTRYTPHTTEKWAQVSLVFSLTQRPTETIMSFIDKVRNQAAMAQLPEEQQLQAVLKGLQPQARTLIVQQNPRTMAQLLEHARVADAALGLTNNTEKNITPAVAAAATPVPANSEIAKQLTEITEQLQQLATRGRERSRDREQNYGRRNDLYGSNRSHTPPPLHRTPQPSRPVSPGRNHQYQTNGPRPNQGRRQVTFDSCRGCGEYPSHDISRCRARNANCYRCGLIGHLSKVCLSARK